MKKFIYVIALVLFSSLSFEVLASNCDDEWYEKQTKKIQIDYNEAVRKIEKSSLTEKTKYILKEQALHNKELGERYLYDKNHMCMEHKFQRKTFTDDLRKTRYSRKIIKEIDNIGSK